MDIQTIRELAEKYSHAELEACIDEHISEGKNACWCCDSAEETVNILSKASYMKRLVETGKAESLQEAMRILAKSMRDIQQT